jgi:hypothetical protein
MRLRSSATADIGPADVASVVDPDRRHARGSEKILCEIVLVALLARSKVRPDLRL